MFQLLTPPSQQRNEVITPFRKKMLTPCSLTNSYTLSSVSLTSSSKGPIYLESHYYPGSDSSLADWPPTITCAPFVSHYISQLLTRTWKMMEREALAESTSRLAHVSQAQGSALCQHFHHLKKTHKVFYCASWTAMRRLFIHCII